VKKDKTKSPDKNIIPGKNAIPSRKEGLQKDMIGKNTSSKSEKYSSDAIKIGAGAIATDPSLIMRAAIDTIGEHWPRHTLYHGAVCNVQWGQPIENNDAYELDAAIGVNQEEALAALISSELAENNAQISEQERQEFEKFFVGFTHDLLGELDTVDGEYRFEHEVHKESFHAIDGGILFDYVKEEEKRFEPTKNRRGSGAFVKNHIAQQQTGIGQQMEEFGYQGISKDPAALVNDLQFDFTPEEKPTPKVTAYPAPRYFEPRDPVLLLSDQLRSTKALDEGYYHPEGLTKVRTIADIHRLVGEPNRTHTFAKNRLWMPMEIDALYDELRYMEGFEGDYSTTMKLYTLGGYTVKKLRNSLPSPIAYQQWKQAWLPLFADIKFKFYPDKEHWELKGVDYQRTSGHEAIQANENEAIIITERLPITRSAPNVVVSQINKFLKDEDELDELNDGVLDDDEEDMLDQLVFDFKQRDLLSITLSGLDNKLNELSETQPIRAGLVEILELNIVDAFGNLREIRPEGLLNFDSGQPPKVSIGLSLQNHRDESGKIVIRPRIPKPSRLDFRLLAHNDDTRPATGGTAALLNSDLVASPICGYLLPDHIEWAMEVFDNEGNARGQLRVADRDWTLGGIQKGQLAWDNNPGNFSAAGTAPDCGNKHLDRIVNSLMEVGRIDEQERNLENAGEGVLSALLRAIDTTYWHSDPYGKGGINHPSFYMGRPVAVVRALLRLQVEGGWTQLSEAQRKHAFQVKLGSIEREIDGLLGYFIDDDYTRFNTVFPIDESGAPIPQSDQSIDHEFLSFDNTLDVLPETDIFLTLLLHPQSALHLTSGFLPQKEILLLREHWEEAMAKIAPTFKVGPVLVDPTSIRMPIDDGKPQMQWKWLHRESPSSVLQSDVKASDDLAGLPNGKMLAYEGWLKLNQIDKGE
jgi:hypothetical protein